MLEDTWFSRDMPVLEAAVAEVDQTTRGVRVLELVDLTGLDRAQVINALRALEGTYLSVSWDRRETGLAGGTVHGCTAEARRAVGSWPSAESLAERALAVVEERIQAAVDLDERSRWVKLRDVIAGAGRDLLVDIMGAVVSRQITGG